MGLDELIKKLFEEGKALDVMVAEAAKVVPSTQKIDDTIEAVKRIVAGLEAAKKVKDDAEKTIQDEAEKKDIDEAVKNYFKALPPDPAKLPEVKMFSTVSGKWESSKGMSEDSKAFVDLVVATSTKDLASARDIQKSIAVQKESDYKAMGFSSDVVKAYLYTDATTGSYMIPTEVEGQIFERAWQSRILSRVNTRAITYNAKLYPVMAQMDFAFLANEAAQLGDKSPTIDNPEIDMKRFGGLAFVSNQLLIMKGPELSRALANGFGDALARFADLYIPCASVTGNSDLFNGMIFDSRSRQGTTKALSAANIQDLQELKNLLGPKWRADAIFYGNTNVRDTYGLLNSDNIPLFRNFVETGNFSPFGLEFLEVPYIPSTFDAATMRTTGTADVLGCFNPQGVFVGFEPLRLDVSREFKFDYDLTAFRAVSRIGEAVISSASTQGAVSSFKYLTN